MLLLLFSSHAHSADPKYTPKYEFHGDAIGESWDEFRSKYKFDSIMCSGDPEVLDKHSLADESSVLLDSEREFYGPGSHTIACRFRAKEQTLSRVRTTSVTYDFYSDKLSSITICLFTKDDTDLMTILLSYEDKYGEPSGRNYHMDHDTTMTVWEDKKRGYELLMKSQNQPDEKTDRKFTLVLIFDTSIDNKTAKGDDL